MPNLPPFQPTFDEAQAIAEDAALQQLRRWYPDQEDRILAAWRRRHRILQPHCSCPHCTTRSSRRRPSPQTRPRYRSPSSAGQYREQLHK